MYTNLSVDEYTLLPIAGIFRAKDNVMLPESPIVLAMASLDNSNSKMPTVSTALVSTTDRDEPITPRTDVNEVEPTEASVAMALL